MHKLQTTAVDAWVGYRSKQQMAMARGVAL